MIYELLRFAHVVGFGLIAAGLLGVFIADLRSRQLTDLALFAEAIRNIGVFYDGLVVPGALLLLASGTWLIIEFYAGWTFLDVPWLGGMVLLFAIEFIEGNTITRVYFVRLLSRATDFTARVSFAYPDDVRAAWDAYQQRQADQMKMVAAELPPASIDKLFFGYEMQGDQKFRPVRVFDDGQKTYIQLPEEVRHREQPSLVVLGKDGKEQLVNYRTRNDYFIVDRLFDRAALILGVGGNQEKVTIERRESKGAWSWFGFGNRTASRSTDSGAMLSGVENVQ